MSLQESLRYLVSWDLDDLCNQPDREAAHGLNERAKAWDFILERAPLAFSDYGRIAWEFQKRELWRHVLDEHEEPFRSFEHWVNSGAPKGRRYMYKAKEKFEALVSDVAPSKLKGIARGNLETLIQCSSAVRNEPEVLEAAKTLSTPEFLSHIETNHPDQHFEGVEKLWFEPDRAAVPKINECIAYAIDHGIARNRGEALERMAEVALDDWKQEQVILEEAARLNEPAEKEYLN